MFYKIKLFAILIILPVLITLLLNSCGNINWAGTSDNSTTDNGGDGGGNSGGNSGGDSGGDGDGGSCGMINQHEKLRGDGC